MAHKIIVLPDNSKISKVMADLMVRRLLADWEKQGISIRRRLLAPATPILPAARFSLPPKPYIPIKMPFAELPGVVTDLETAQTRATARFANAWAAQEQRLG